MYTYDDFVKAASKAGVMDRFSQEELAATQKSPEFGISLVGLLQDEKNATTAEQRLLATEAANQMRKSYGLLNTNVPSSSPVANTGRDNYAGLLDQANAQSSFAAAAPAAETQDNYAGLLDQGGTQTSFVYDPEQDPVWSAYKKQYTREGERASANAMAQAAAMSGGRPSSYAVTAGQQAGNYYAGQMSDIIPELAQDAYTRYLNEQDLKQQEFNNALNLYQTLGYATPEVAKILGISDGGQEVTGGTGGNYTGGDQTDDEEEDAEDQGSELTIDLDSVLSLGYGPISEARLNELVAAGAVKEVVDGNTIRFVKADHRSAYPFLDFTQAMKDKAKKESSGGTKKKEDPKAGPSSGRG